MKDPLACVTTVTISLENVVHGDPMPLVTGLPELPDRFDITLSCRRAESAPKYLRDAYMLRLEALTHALLERDYICDTFTDTSCLNKVWRFTRRGSPLPALCVPSLPPFDENTPHPVG